jgi:hypothetical protein
VSTTASLSSAAPEPSAEQSQREHAEADEARRRSVILALDGARVELALWAVPYCLAPPDEP